MPTIRETARLRPPRHPRTERSRRPRIATAALSLAVLIVAGCQLPNADKAAEQESILAIVTSSVPSPEEATRMVNDPTNPDRRARGLTLLMNAPFGGEPVYVDLYERRIAPADPISGIESEHPAVRAVAARALSLHGDPGHVGLILPLFEHDDPQVRLQAVQALQRLHNPIAIDPLLQRIRYEVASGQVVEPEPDIRAAAADALGQYAERGVVLGLMTALDDDSLAVTSRALNSLRTLTGQDFSDDRREWQRWFESTSAHFAGRTPYVYPVFQRDFRWTDIIPFTRPAENEIPANPIGAQAG